MKREDILKICYDRAGRCVSGSLQKIVIQQIDNYDELEGDTFSEKIYLLKTQTHKPNCLTCGKPLKYPRSRGYATYCSDKCKANNQRWKDNRKGMGFQSPKVQQKIKDVMLERYGVNNISKASHIRERISQRMKSNGKNWRNSSETIKNTITKIESFGFEVLNIETNDETYYDLYCKKHNHQWRWSRIEDKTQTQYPICQYCHNEKTSLAEKEIAKFVQSLSNNVLLNDQSIIGPKELDIYLPDLKLAIEYNGTYWHGYHHCSFLSLDKLKKKSSEKRVLCQQLGIRVITIDECDWNDRPDVFKRFLIDQIKPRQRIYARNCEIKSIDSKTARQFCEYYHVNGYRASSERLGLFYNDKLICVATFSKYKQAYECVRLAFKTGYDIIGGWSKIQKHFGRPFLHYVNLKYFSGENKTGIGYRFVLKNGKILHRNSLQKKTGLYKYCKDIDPSISDFQNCINNKMTCVFDCGNDIRWYNKKEI
jgi:G:T-mismatch repair DNA endonuclease (very short patch repair protein)/endogenous inhibitor of DNA gyrase (YacG/DUF329 family)